MIEGKYAGDPTITMQLVCKIKSEIIIIIIIDTMPQSATTVKTMEIKALLLLCYSYEGLKKSGRAIQNLKSEGFAFVYWRRNGGRRYAGLNGGG
jgi:hypothetical protein